jgi:hypothetical protein
MMTSLGTVFGAPEGVVGQYGLFCLRMVTSVGTFFRALAPGDIMGARTTGD